jgi:UDP-3-O-[3-hydroxymyristoyl] glucosamine N-acyltransferase
VAEAAGRRPEIAGDPRFFTRAGPHSLAAVAQAARVDVPAAELILTGVAPLQTAGPTEVSFLDNRKYAAALSATCAGAVIVRADMASRVPAGTIAIAAPDAYAAWARVAALFHPLPPSRPGRHPSAVIAAEARVDPSAEIGPLAVIGAHAQVGPRCIIGPGTVIGDGVVLGPDCRIGAHASLSHALVGARVMIYPGARIGQDGFGFVAADEGFRAVPQLGRVIIEDDVSVGANTTIDRGSTRDTVIGAGSCLDNLVQIGHNVHLGRACVVVAMVGISGSTIVEDHVTIGGQAGFVGHIRIGRGARIGAQAGVMSDVAAGAEVVGSPALPVREFFRQIATLRRLTRKLATARGDKRETD